MTLVVRWALRGELIEVFEQIIPRYCDLLGMNRQLSYEEVGIRLLEEVALRCDIERFTIYHLEEFINSLKNHYQSSQGAVVNQLPDLIKHNRVLSRTVRSRIMAETADQLYYSLAEPRKLNLAQKVEETTVLT